MKRQRLFVLWLCFCLGFVTKSFAQFSDNVGNVPPSPSASSIVKTINTPVDMYSGRASITAPLGEVKTPRFELPIALDYISSGGIKIQDISGNVGLGWDLQAGGAITRVVNGLPDESADGYSGANQRGALIANPNTVVTAYFDNVMKDNYDAEPDIFYFHFLNISGKFVLDKNRVPVLLPDVGVRVVQNPFSDPNSPFWILSDLKGNLYYLGETPESREQTNSTMSTLEQQKTLNFTSTWNLTKIISADQSDVVQFTYISGPTITYDYKKYRQKWRTKKNSPTDQPHPVDISLGHENTLIQITPSYISGINSSNAHVIMAYSDPSRSDLSGGRFLQDISITDIDFNPQKKIGLQYSYFKTSPSSTSTDEIRLKLDKITITDKTGNSTIDGYKFDYNMTVNLPSKGSIQYDHWGYYNNNPYDKEIPVPNFVFDAFAGLIQETPYIPQDVNVMKGADPDRCKANILTKITYTGGGYTEYDYELNDYSYVDDNNNIQSKQGGGLRIKSVKNYDGINSVTNSATFYNYNDDNGVSTGRLLVDPPKYLDLVTETSVFNPTQILAPQYQSFSHTSGVTLPNITVDNFIPPIKPYFGPPPLPISIPQLGFISNFINIQAIFSSIVSLFSHHDGYTGPFVNAYSTSNTMQFDMSGNAIGYDRVITTGLDNSRVVTTFTNNYDYPDLDKTFTLASDGSTTGVYGAPNVPPFNPKTSYAFARGLPKKIEYYTSANVKVKEVINDYTLSPAGNTADALKAAITSYQNNNPIIVHYYTIGWYGFIQHNLWLTRTMESSFDTNGAYPTTVTTEYTYNNQNLPSTAIITDSKGDKEKVTYRYPFDLVPLPASPVTPQLPLSYMVQHNMIDVPIETVHSKTIAGSYKTLGAQLSLFGPSDDNTYIQPVANLALSTKVPLDNYTSFGVNVGSQEVQTRDSRLEIGNVYTRFSPKGNVLETATNLPPQAIDSYGRIVSGALNPAYSKFTSYGWDSKDIFLKTLSTNSRLNEFYSDDFEEGTDFPSGVSQVATKSHTGNKAGYIANGNPAGVEAYYHSNTTLNINLNGQAKKFHYSGWFYSDGPTIEFWLFMKRAGETAYFTYLDQAATSQTGKWVFLEKDFLVPADVTQLNLRIDNNGGGNIWFDDLRLYPSDGQMSTYTYSSDVGMTSTTDARSNSTYYEYDGSNRLQYVKDRDRNILKAYCYNYKGQQTNCFAPVVQMAPDVFARVEISNSTFNNDVSTDGNGSITGTNNWSMADVYVRLYSDPGCNNPLPAPLDLTVTLATDESWSDNYNSGDVVYNNDFVIPAGHTEQLLGNFSQWANYQYFDPYYSSYSSYTYTYSLAAHSGSNYQPKPTVNK